MGNLLRIGPSSGARSDKKLIMKRDTAKKTKILFICIGNMCRSPMAEGFARALGGDVVDAYSAGIHPTGVVSEDSILIMEEKGIDISRQRSKSLGNTPLSEIDIIVSMVGYPPEEFIPEQFRGKVIDWDVEDPIGKSIGLFRRVRDEIEEKVTALLEDVRKANYSSSK